jgi:hypothetical protein
MKIKLSKNQWAFIGKKAGWMKSAYDENLLNVLPKAWATVINDLSKRLGKEVNGNSPRMLSRNIEWMDEALGQSYVQIYYDETSNSMCVERYYENEFQQEEHGRVLRWTFDPANVNAMVEKAVAAVESV